MGFGTPVALLVGMIMVVGAVGLFFFDKIRPAYARDSDKVYAVFILLAGLVALVNWQMDAGPSFLLFVMAGMITTLLIENFRSRVPSTETMHLPLNNRPPRPRYNERPPSRRVYRAELDNRGNTFQEPSRAPRMAPAQGEYWRDDYGNARTRQPYEEYRGPAGRLQPSEDRGRNAYPDNPRYNDGNGRYGERPPARPPTTGAANDERPLAARPPQDRPRPVESDNFQQRPPQQRPPQQNLDRPPSWQPDNTLNSPSGAPSRPEQAAAPSRERPANSDRALNVRPYSEAPKLDLPKEEG
ncbi:MAG: hypothetical protein HC800_21280 [Phormidesmis sp. RL_2_1]|nr:hypothetical protein [Phormidesmis sp. RL_2_1]